jgi:hypothetical protein
MAHFVSNRRYIPTSPQASFCQKYGSVKGDFCGLSNPTALSSLISIKRLMRLCPTRLAPASFLSFLVAFCCNPACLVLNR